MIYNNKIKYQPELYFEGPYYKNLRFPNFHTLQKLTSLVASRITEVQILLLQRMSIYEGNKSNDRLFYLLINSHGFPVYFHLIDLDLHNLSSVLYADIQLLERKFKCKIYIYEHPSITP
jgi:hypothetical protein